MVPRGSALLQEALDLNIQFRLILEIHKDPQGNECVILDIEDYH
jgi:plasmid maintenance system killer protein